MKLSVCCLYCQVQPEAPADYVVAESDPSRPSDLTITDNAEPEGTGRGRRARASVVSYKEPSLVK